MKHSIHHKKLDQSDTAISEVFNRDEVDPQGGIMGSQSGNYGFSEGELWVLRGRIVSRVSLVGQESNHRFWPIWLVTWAGIILVLIQGLNLLE